MASFADATCVRPINSDSYSANFHPDWCIGSVPHGGYVTSCFLTVAQLHFSTTLESHNQPHTISLQLSFLRRTSIGPAIFVVSESKLGRRTSTIHISLSQRNQPPCVVGYLTQSNLHTETGVSLPTNYTLTPPPPPLSSTDALERDDDPNWTYFEKPFTNFRKAGRHISSYLPRKRQTVVEGEGGGGEEEEQAIIDQWLHLTNSQKFTQESLGCVADSFPQITETVYTPSDLDSASASTKSKSQSQSHSQLQPPFKTPPSSPQDKSHWAKHWYPTVTLNMDFKKALPDEGVEWLFSRVRSKAIRNGRMDLEVEIWDEGGQVVALCTHVALIVGAERNMERSGREGQSRERKASRL
ncbi:hypothetical protein N7G274_001510 [Stereocaulon virgatum]|uniref:Thioesterase-like superfamily-domain-containing protein n=1 Tax=Stereocaulon virgatum TaxID=373712 RepID=A0ABR4AJV8_9LECA